MVSDTTMQIFLSIYHGSLITTFLFENIIRNIVRLILNGPERVYATNIALGVCYIAAVVWMIFTVWKKIKRNLLISLVILVIIFVIRLTVGIQENVERHRNFFDKQYTEDSVIFIIEILIHLFGIIATWLLMNHSSDRS